MGCKNVHVWCAYVHCVEVLVLAACMRMCILYVHVYVHVHVHVYVHVVGACVYVTSTRQVASPSMLGSGRVQ